MSMDDVHSWAWRKAWGGGGCGKACCKRGHHCSLWPVGASGAKLDRPKLFKRNKKIQSFR